MDVAYRRPSGLSNIHLWFIGQGVRLNHVYIVEEGCGPCRGLLHSDIGEPRVYISQLKTCGVFRERAEQCELEIEHTP